MIVTIVAADATAPICANKSVVATRIPRRARVNAYPKRKHVDSIFHIQ